MIDSVDIGKPSAQSIVAEASEASKLCDWGRAAALWAEFCALQPNHVGGRVQLISCLAAAKRPGEADQAACEAMDEFPAEYQIFAAWARLSDAKREWPEALSRWTSVFNRFPDDAVAFMGVLAALRELRRFDEAEAFLALHGAQFSANFHVAAAAAWLATTARNWPLAESRWHALREGWPESHNGYVGGAGSLRELGRYDEAELLLRAAIERFGRLPDLIMTLASILEARKDWEGASAYWQEAASMMPDNPAVFLGQARILLRTGRGEEANALLARLADRFPESADVVFMQGMRAEERKDWLAALACWEKATVLAPTRLFFLARQGEALGRLDRHREAEELLEQALAKEPTSIDLMCSSAALAHARCDWMEARKRWRRVLDRDPSHNVAIFQMGIVNYHLSGIESDRSSEIASAMPAAKPVPEPTHQGNAKDTAQDPARGNAQISTVEMFMQMHSLGDNCEFGLVQRKFGAEPLGLFRWTAVNIEMLSEALDHDLEGIGLPEHTRLELRDDEYHLSDTRYLTRMHTFIHSNQENDPERFRLKLCKRQQYLGRLLLAELREGRQRLYVYKASHGYRPGAIERLCRSLQRLGPNTLLCVKLADQDHPEGTAEMIDSNLIIGYLSNFAPEGGWPKTAFESWRKMSEQAFALWQKIVAGSQETRAPGNTTASLRQ